MTVNEANRIHERIDDLVKEFGKMNTAVQTIKTACVPCHQRVDRISGVLAGNGTEGLVARVVRIEEANNHRSWFATIMTHGVTATVSGIIIGLVVALLVG